MARIRTIKPEFWGDAKTAQVSRDARLLFIGLLNESDDEGRQLASPRRIAGIVFPHDDDTTSAHVAAWLDELERAKFIHRYSVAGVRYLLICGFTEHQKISHPALSRLPSPADADPEPLAQPSGDPPEFLQSLAGVAPEILSPDLGIDLGIDLGSGSIAPVDESTGRSEATPAVINIAPAKQRRADPIWDALLQACGIAPHQVTASSRGKYNKAVKDLRDVGATPDDIFERVTVYRTKFAHAALTPTAIASHWAELLPSRQPVPISEGMRNLAALQNLREQGVIG